MHASDIDIGENGEVMYELADDVNQKFSINSTTGSIMLNASLSFGDGSSYALRVHAKDKGVPQRSSDVIVQVQVEDVNSYSPVFSKSIYTASIDENVVLMTSVANVTATDQDSGPSGDILYAIVTEGTPFVMEQGLPKSFSRSTRGQFHW